MKTIVMIPTYNEKENIGKLINQVLALKIENLEMVVIDDSSPDGTAEIVKGIASKNKKVHLILRTKNKGRGYAGKAGYKYALEHNADYIIEMDADFSHNPEYIPELLKKIKECDLVLGSRAVKGGKEVGRNIIRMVITKIANFYIRTLLGLNVKDTNSGFRCFRRSVLENIGVDNITSKGPSIVQEVLFRAHLKGFKIKEIPILFRERKVGTSKLGIPQLFGGYIMVLKLKLLHLIKAI